jgi:hypothetical protein
LFGAEEADKDLHTRMLKALDLWLPAYLSRPAKREVTGTTHIILTVCDHFEPFHNAKKPEAMARVAEWREKFPKLTDTRDADGLAPKHTFFYPIEQYDPDVIEAIADICRVTGCETEVHLHHDKDTEQGVRNALEQGKKDFLRHNLLSTDSSGMTRYAFIHGNWALDHSHPEGKGCGVPNELSILKETGCYADLTLPSAPNRTQTHIINSLYYSSENGAPKSHDSGVLARVGTPPSGDLLLIQGPLGLNWRWRKFGVIPRIENADLTAANPPTVSRLRLWLDLQIHVQGRPEWVFIKLHTHGAPSPNREMLLGKPMQDFHAQLGSFVKSSSGKYALHYATAREMANILHAAEDGHTGNPGEFRDYSLRSNIVRNSHHTLPHP